MKNFIKKWIIRLVNENTKDTRRMDQPQVEDSDGLNENYVFDFRSARWRGGGVVPSIYYGTATEGNSSTSDNQKPELKLKIMVKPIDVLKELEMAPRIFALDNIDEKIAILNDKADLIKNSSYSKREISGLIECLENRKKYDKYFTQFQTTTQEKIDTLLKKYELVMKEADIFIPDFPDEAIKIMKKYKSKVKFVSGKEPVFYVIATSDNFKSAEDKRDPILLSQSPFGMYYDILGAWDKEMLLLSEL